MSEVPRPSVRPSMLQLSITSKSALYAAYMPFLVNGGLFVPTKFDYELGDEVFLLLQLMDDPAKLPVITPAGAQGGKVEGIGVHFNDDDAGKQLRGRIETLLAGALGSSRPTHTL